jgi:hypothetical protein
MKAIFIFICLLAVTVIAQAQGTTIYRLGYPPTMIVDVDIITNTGTDIATVLIKLPEQIGVCVNVMTASVTKTGTLDLDINYQASMDNSSFFTLASDSLATNNTTYLWTSQTSYPKGFPGRYLKVLATGVGTQSSTWSAWVYVFKLPD